MSVHPPIRAQPILTKSKPPKPLPLPLPLPLFLLTGASSSSHQNGLHAKSLESFDHLETTIQSAFHIHPPRRPPPERAKARSIQSLR
ncbi:hypothetical protein OIU74_025566 [Salix koriyanagi]|uniref:Uncharacterized protein n=1 Tax=Salix koriyanagi TaxID=2511006 RepID=A0A9Q0W4M1_9ROSI|nr:hypothetical protein OIU74_025566 [Salix koriyanagi]